MTVVGNFQGESSVRATYCMVLKFCVIDLIILRKLGHGDRAKSTFGFSFMRLKEARCHKYVHFGTVVFQTTLAFQGGVISAFPF
jgi:hypothetical protein